jgi:hypothetical protein
MFKFRLLFSLTSKFPSNRILIELSVEKDSLSFNRLTLGFNESPSPSLSESLSLTTDFF